MTKLSNRFESEFESDAFVIDPPTCGCTDCLMGYSTPLDEVRIGDLLTAVLDFGMEIVDRSGRKRGQA
jgi:hypothetical protein